MNPFIVPKPLELVLKEDSFILKDNFTVYLDPKLDLTLISDFIKDHILPSTGFHFQTNQTDAQLMFTHRDDIPKEGYELNLTKDKLVVEASTQSGHLYGLITFMQLLPPEIFSDTIINSITSWAAPCVSIKDKPQYGWRGMHLDCSRHFFTVPEIKKYLFWMSLHKLNTFHWHLVDDDGWRFESKKYPNLTKVGSVRTESDGTQYGPFFYTQNEMKEIVKFAKKLCITVVPEIEMPGHSTAAIESYPNLSCGIKIPRKSYWSRYKYTLCFCVSKTETLDFLKDILAEAIEIFDSEYIHIGGDEVIPYYWEKCPNCQSVIRREGFRDLDEYQCWFTNQIAEYLEQKGRKMIGWDEILQEKLRKGSSVMVWRDASIAEQAVEGGFPVILVPNSHLYFDHNQFNMHDKLDRQYPYFGGLSTLRNVYSFEPQKTVSDEKMIIGVQACAWAEVMFDFRNVQWKVFPRMCAMSEVAWTSPDLKNYDEFKKGLINVHLKRLDAMNINYAHKLKKQD